ncbi:MAG: DJ-1/PfpI family protein [Candidatus Sericytochromatia bacterium]
MRIALITLEGFNEIDTFVACTLLNRVREPDWEVAVSCPGPSVTSMNGVTIQAQQPLGYARSADVVLFGSGRYSLEQSQDPDLLALLRFDPARQLIGSQCSGALLLHALGLIGEQTVCTDLKTSPLLEARGLTVLDRPFVAHGGLAMAGGCLAAQYLAAWVICKGPGLEAARSALAQIAPVGQIGSYVNAALEAIGAG